MKISVALPETWPAEKDFYTEEELKDVEWIPLAEAEVVHEEWPKTAARHR